MALDFLYRGTPGHPLHPPLTDATIGTYAFATVAAVMSKVGIAESEAAQGWTLALIVGLLFSAPTALTGFADWLQIARGTPLWRTATAHMIAMLDRDGASSSSRSAPATATASTARSATARSS